MPFWTADATGDSNPSVNHEWKHKSDYSKSNSSVVIAGNPAKKDSASRVDLESKEDRKPISSDPKKPLEKEPPSNDEETKVKEANASSDNRQSSDTVILEKKKPEEKEDGSKENSDSKQGSEDRFVDKNTVIQNTIEDQKEEVSDKKQDDFHGHRIFAELLEKYVSHSGQVDYKGLSTDVKRLDLYLSRLERKAVM